MRSSRCHHLMKRSGPCGALAPGIRTRNPPRASSWPRVTSPVQRMEASRKVRLVLEVWAGEGQMEERSGGLLHLSKTVVHLHLPSWLLLSAPSKATCLPAFPSASSLSTTSLCASSILFVFSSPKSSAPGCHHQGSVTSCWSHCPPWGQSCPFAAQCSGSSCLSNSSPWSSPTHLRVMLRGYLS